MQLKKNNYLLHVRQDVHRLFIGKQCTRPPSSSQRLPFLLRILSSRKHSLYRTTVQPCKPLQLISLHTSYGPKSTPMKTLHSPVLIACPVAKWYEVPTVPVSAPIFPPESASRTMIFKSLGYWKWLQVFYMQEWVLATKMCSMAKPMPWFPSFTSKYFRMVYKSCPSCRWTSLHVDSLKRGVHKMLSFPNSQSGEDLLLPSGIIWSTFFEFLDYNPELKFRS